MKGKKKLAFLVVLLALALAFTMTACGGSGSDSGDDSATGEPVKFRLASDAVEGNIMYDLNQKLCDEINERTDGRVQVDYYPASQLGSYETVYQEVVLGNIDMAHICLPETNDSRFCLAFLPGLARSYDELNTMFGKGSYVDTVLKEICAEKGIVLLATTAEGFENVASAREVKDPFVPGADKGVTCRCSGFEMTRILLDELGYEPTTIAWGEIPTSLQTGVVDAWLGGTAVHHYTYTGDVINYSYIADLQPSCYPIVISQKSWDKLTPEDQETVRAVAEEIGAECISKAAETEQEYIQKMQDKGIEVVVATDEEKAEIASFIRENVWPQYEELLTKEVIDGMYNDLEEKGLN